MKTNCGKCGMNFRVENAPTDRHQFAKCPEDGCGRRFWHATKTARDDGGHKIASPVCVGMTPADFAAFAFTGAPQ